MQGTQIRCSTENRDNSRRAFRLSAVFRASPNPPAGKARGEGESGSTKIHLALKAALHRRKGFDNREIDRRTHRRGVERQDRPGRRRDRPSGRRLDRALHRPLPQGGDRGARRHAAADARGPSRLSARPRGTTPIDPRFDPRTGQARHGARGPDQRGRDQGPARRHLPAVQAEAAHQGADRARERARSARRGAFRPSGARAARPGRSLPEARRRQERTGGARRGACDPRRAFRRGRRTHRPAARGFLDRAAGSSRKYATARRRREPNSPTISTSSSR